MFQYLPYAYPPLSAGVHTLSVVFTPDDSVNYTQATASVTLTVLKATSSVTWSPPSPIVFGTPLDATQLNASANYPGTFSYTPGAGTILNAGSQTLTVSFIPNDSNVSSAAASVTLVVLKAATQLTWNAPSPLIYGTALGAAQLNASADRPGTFTYSPAAGTVLNAGTYALSVTFTPADAANYNGAVGSVSIAVGAAPLTIRANDSTKVYGSALPAFTISSAGFVNGDTIGSLGGAVTFSTTASQTSAPGTYVVAPGGVSSPNYAIAFQSGTLTVTKAATSMGLSASPSPSQNNKPVTLTATISVVAPGSGLSTGSVEFRDKGVLLGTAPLVNGSASLTVSLRKGSHPLAAAWVGDANFTGSNAAITHQVN
jgi:MBG domain (YGX type)/Bacterial Ig-like domain (group 3)